MALESITTVQFETCSARAIVHRTVHGSRDCPVFGAAIASSSYWFRYVHVLDTERPLKIFM